MSDNWEYGGAYKAYDMSGEIALPNGSRVAVCDWTLGMPDFMREADTLFIDPPWNAGNVRSFYTKADIEAGPFDFLAFTETLWRRIDEINPKTLLIEMGKEHLWRYLEKAGSRFKYVTFYNSTYYNKRDNKCYVVHATNDGSARRHKELEDMDEEQIIKWVCANHRYDCIGDLCMGRGLVGRHAYMHGHRFVGTELNRKRLAVLVDFIRQAEARAAVAAAS
jgi:hypothetical protein